MTAELQYLPTLTLEHIEAASAALKKIAALASCPDESGQRARRCVRVGLVDHGAFLSLQLRSFAMMEVDQKGYLLNVADSGEVVLAMVANQPVSVQITTLLQFLETFLARQHLTAEIRSGGRGIADIDAIALSADESATRQVQDDLRIGDWERTARRISDRARNDGYALEVRFAEPLLEKNQIDLRLPLLRHVYNTQEVVRKAVDRVAGISLSLHLAGDDVPPEAFRQTQALLDVSALQRFSAHLMRDAFVCGNGYLALGDDRNQSSMRLFLPELVRHVGEGHYEAREEPGGEFRPVVGYVLHHTGARQVGSEYGLSLLEPFIQIAATNEALESGIHDVAMLQPPPHRVEEASAWLQHVISLRERTFAENAKRVATILGGATASLRDPSSEALYFPGLAFMDNAAERLRFRDPVRRNTE